MKTYLTLGLLILSSTALAAFQNDPTIIYEGAIVLTVSTPKERYVLVYECESCTPVKMGLSGSSIIKINGGTATMPELFARARWRADVFAEAETPTTVSRISTY